MPGSDVVVAGACDAETHLTCPPCTLRCHLSGHRRAHSRRKHLPLAAIHAQEWPAIRALQSTTTSTSAGSATMPAAGCVIYLKYRLSRLSLKFGRQSCLGQGLRGQPAEFGIYRALLTMLKRTPRRTRARVQTTASSTAPQTTSACCRTATPTMWCAAHRCAEKSPSHPVLMNCFASSCTVSPSTHC